MRWNPLFGLLTALLMTACSSGKNCQPEDHTTCRGGDLFWVDSCGELGYRIKVCECDCDEAGTGCEFPCPDCTADADCSHMGANYYCDLDSGQCRCAPQCDGLCCGDDGCGAVCPDECGVGMECDLLTCGCVPEGSCSDGQTRCEGDVVEVCADNAWGDQEDCAAAGEACEGGACVCVPAGDEVCNGEDDDCDGQTDEDLTPLLVAEAGAEASDGIDNNCNGLIDEPGGVMVEVQNLAGDRVWIDVYETTVFENPDCTGARYGAAGDDYPAEWPADGPNQIDLYACSLLGLVPSGSMSRWRAARACQAQGKRLCTKTEWTNGCAVASSFYPWPVPSLPPGACNDVLSGPNVPVETGSFEGCVGINLTYDMVGNLAEWLSDPHDGDPAVGWHAGGSYALLICFVDDCHVADLDNDSHVNVLTSTVDCVPGPSAFNGYPPALVREDLGARCCLDGP